MKFILVKKRPIQKETKMPIPPNIGISPSCFFLSDGESTKPKELAKGMKEKAITMKDTTDMI